LFVVICEKFGIPDDPAPRVVLANDRVFEPARQRAGHDVFFLLGVRRARRRVREEGCVVILAKHLGGGIPGEFFREWAEVQDVVLAAQNDDHARRGFDQRAKGRVGAFFGLRQLLTFGDAREAAAQRVGIERLDDVVRGALLHGENRPRKPADAR
jgi:hypothetical protein